MDHIAAVKELISGGLNAKEPKRSGGLTLVPLFGGVLAKDYLVGADAITAGLLSITEVDEHGDVTHLVANNQANSPVLLIDGEHLEGAKQNRILNATVLLAASRKTTLPVACVEEGRWHYEANSDFNASDDFAYGRLRSRNASAKADSLRMSGSRDVDQGEVWADISRKHDEAGSASPTGAMRDAFDHHRGDLDEMKVAFSAPEPGQTGVIACVDGRPVALDAFDRPETLTKLWPRLLSGYALDAVGHSQAGVEPDAIASFLESAAGAATTSHEGLGLGMDVVITSDSVVGNALTWGEGVIHLALFARAGDGPDASRRAGRIAAPSQRHNFRH